MRNTLLMEKLPLAIAIIVKSIGGPYLVSAQGRGAGTMICWTGASVRSLSPSRIR